MQGMEFMIKRAEYRKEKEAPLFEQVAKWARAADDEVVAEIVVGQHAGNGDDQTGRGRNQSLTNVTSEFLRLAHALRTNGLEGFNHTRNRTQQSQHRSRCTNN